MDMDNEFDATTTVGSVFQMYTMRQKKGTTFLLRINLLMHNVIWQNLILLLLMNIIIDVIYLISGIYTNFHRLPCKKCDVGYYVINLRSMRMGLLADCDQETNPNSTHSDQPFQKLIYTICYS